MSDPGDLFTSCSAEQINDMVHAVERAASKLNHWIAECRRGKPHHKDHLAVVKRDAASLKLLRNALAQKANYARRRDYARKHGIGEYRDCADEGGGGNVDGKQ